MRPDELEPLTRRGQALVGRTTREHERRWRLGHARRWSLDQELGRLVWTFDELTASAPAQVLGSWSAQSSSFVWAWDNDSVSDPLRVDAGRVRAYGVEHDLLALRSSPLSLSLQQATDLVALAVGLVGANGLYHSFDGRMASYLTFGEVLLEHVDGRRETVLVDAA